MASASPYAIVGGSDGNLWVTERTPEGGAIMRVGLDGRQATFPLPAGAHPAGIIAGPDGALWFADQGRSAIGRITTTGQVREFPTPSAPGDTLTLAADGSIWFAEPSTDRLARLTVAGQLSEVALPEGSRPDAIAAGPDGGIWFGEDGAGVLGRAALKGTITTLPLADPAERVTAIANGPGPALWYIATSTTTYAHLGHVDATGHTIEQSLGPGPTPTAIGLGPDGQLWLAGPTTNTIRTATANTSSPRR